MQQVYQYLTGESVRNKTSDAYIAQIINERLAQPEQEPVAYIGTNGELMWLHKPHAIYSKARPLYTAPPQRKPLTDEELEHLFGRIPTRHTLFTARAIERAHGIREKE